MDITFIHTADWQIGKAFATFPGDAGVVLKLQRLKTVEKIAQLACERSVDAVLVCGDIFETNAVSDDTLRKTVNAMSAFQGPWILIPGNHDPYLAESVWSRMRRIGIKDNIHFLTEPEPLILEDKGMVILPAPLQRRHEVSDLTEWFDSYVTPTGLIRIGLAHGSIEGRLPSDRQFYNPIAPERAEKSNLAYLALGDWHGTTNIASRTWYSGTPETDRFKDNDSGNVLLVTVSANNLEPRVEKIPTTYFSWHQLNIELREENDISAIDQAFSNLSEPFERNVVELALQGTLDLASWELVDENIARWNSRIHYLKLDDSELILAPNADDLDRIDKVGFVRTALDNLKCMADDPSHPSTEIARLALHRLYLEYTRLGIE